MSLPAIAVIQFPGSNCERETKMAISRAGMKAVDVLWNSEVDLALFGGFVVVGGFSYEDRGRSGLIASKAPLMDRLKREAEKGKPVLGICNGAQILVESGLVPGCEDYKLGMALTLNKRIVNEELQGTGFYNDWRYVRPMQPSAARIFDGVIAEPIHIPLAHAEGRFVMTNELLGTLKEKGASLWQYCDASGEVNDAFPENPNGSLASLAAVSNLSGNVLAMMPHPERVPAGDVIFQSMKQYIEAASPVTVTPLSETPSVPDIKHYQTTAAHRLLVKMSITDNACVSVNKALKQMGLDVSLSRMDCWEIDADEAQLGAIQESYELFNPSKQFVVDALDPSATYFLAKQDVDSLGAHKLHNLNHQCGIPVKALSHGTVWEVKGADAEATQRLLDEHIFQNPFAGELFQLSD